MATKRKPTKVKLRDLTATKPIKGGDKPGRLASNHNEVFVR
jgi:hypothetical protein